MNWQDAAGPFLRVDERIAVLGIGNTNKGDDAAGSICARSLIKKFGNTTPENIKIIDAREIPENYTGDIRRFDPERILLIDAVISGKSPGTIFIADPKKIENTDVSTHRMPLSMLVHFLENSIGCKVLIIGIEPERVVLDIKISKNVQKSVNTLSDFLYSVLINNNK